MKNNLSCGIAIMVGGIFLILWGIFWALDKIESNASGIFGAVLLCWGYSIIISRHRERK